MRAHAFDQKRFLSSWIFLGVALATLGGFIAFHLLSERANILARERDELLAKSATIDQLISGQLVTMKNLLNSLRETWARSGTHENFNQRLALLKAGLPGVRTFIFLDEHGKALASNRTELLDRDFQSGAAFQHIRNKPNPNSLYVSAPYTTVLGTYTVNAALMIPGPGGRFDGVVMAILDPEFFAPILSSVLSSPDMRVSITHSDGTLFLYKPDNVGMLGRNLAQPGAYFTRHLESGGEVNLYSGLTRASGEERLLAIRTVRPDDVVLDKYLVVSCSRTMAAILAGWYNNLYELSGLFVVLCFLSSGALLAYNRRKLELSRFEELAADTLKKSEQELRENAKRLQLTLDAAKAGTWEWDLRTNQSIWSNQVWGLYCLTPGQTAPSFDSWLSSIHPLDRGAMQQQLRSSVESGRSTTLEWRVNCPDGDVRWLTSQGSPEYGPDGTITRYLGVVMDITERKRMEEDLRRSQRDLKAVLDNMPSVIGYWDKDLRNRFANHAYLSWFGIDPKVIPGMHLRDVIGEERYQLNTPHIEAVLAGEPQEFVRAIPEPLGRRMRYGLTYYIPDVVDGEVQGFYALVTDVTFIKQAEQDMLVSLREKEAMLKEIHHRVKNNLQIIFSLLSLQEQSIDNPEAVHILADSQNRVMSMALIHDQLYQSQNLAGISVGDYLTELLPRVKSAYQGSSAVDIRVDVPPLTLTLDQAIPFGLIMNELTTNALKHAFKERDTGVVSITATVEGESVNVVFRDDGVGLPANFDPEGMSSLGLQIVSMLAGQLHGTWSMESEGGTCFRLAFPLRRD